MSKINYTLLLLFISHVVYSQVQYSFSDDFFSKNELVLEIMATSEMPNFSIQKKTLNTNFAVPLNYNALTIRTNNAVYRFLIENDYIGEKIEFFRDGKGYYCRYYSSNAWKTTPILVQKFSSKARY